MDLLTLCKPIILYFVSYFLFLVCCLYYRRGRQKFTDEDFNLGSHMVVSAIALVLDALDWAKLHTWGTFFILLFFVLYLAAVTVFIRRFGYEEANPTETSGPKIFQVQPFYGIWVGSLLGLPSFLYASFCINLFIKQNPS